MKKTVENDRFFFLAKVMEENSRAKEKVSSVVSVPMFGHGKHEPMDMESVLLRSNCNQPEVGYQ